MTRPSVPFPAPKGYAWRAVIGEGWTTNPALVTGRGCRFGASRDSKAHGAPAVAILYRRGPRGGNRIPWAYCSDHLYGRWIEDGGPLDGLVAEWALRPII